MLYHFKSLTIILICIFINYFFSCPTDPLILGAIAKAKGDGKILQANFDAFKFPTSEIVQFKALVTPCLPSCEPVSNYHYLTGERIY